MSHGAGVSLLETVEPGPCRPQEKCSFAADGVAQPKAKLAEFPLEPVELVGGFVPRLKRGPDDQLAALGNRPAVIVGDLGIEERREVGQTGVGLDPLLNGEILLGPGRPASGRISRGPG